MFIASNVIITDRRAPPQYSRYWSR